MEIAIGYCVGKLIPFYEESYDEESDFSGEFRVWKKDKYRIHSRHGTLKEAYAEADTQNRSHDYTTFAVFIVTLSGKYVRPTLKQKYKTLYPLISESMEFSSFLGQAWKKWLEGKKLC